MKSKLLIALAATLTLTACGSGFVQGESRASYKPVVVGDVDNNERAIIKPAKGFYVRNVDGKRVVNVVTTAMGGGHKSVSLSAGKHRLGLFFNSNVVNVGEIDYQAGHEYFIDFFYAEPQVYYWVKDLTLNKIVWGREMTPELYRSGQRN